MRDLIPRDRGKLNPKLWNPDETLRSEVRKKLLAAASGFYNRLGIDLDLKDVVMTGSNAQYVYTDESDIDVHIIADFGNLKAPDLARKYLDAARSLWGMRHMVKIRGHQVELYVEDVNDPPPAAIYSLVKDAWVKKPTHEIPEEPSQEVIDLAKRLEVRAKKVLKDPIKSHEFLDMIYRKRSEGLRDEGESSPENLAFKALRNSGIIDDLWKTVAASQDNDLSIPEEIRSDGDQDLMELFGL